MCYYFELKVQATYLVRDGKKTMSTLVSKRSIVGVTRKEAFFIMTLMSMLNKIFIVWLFWIEGAGNLHSPCPAKKNLHYGNNWTRASNGGIVRVLVIKTFVVMTTMIVLNGIFTVWLFQVEGAGNLPYPLGREIEKKSLLRQQGQY